MKKNHSCNALKALKIIRIILSIILLSYTLSLCIIGHCASATAFSLPYNLNNTYSFGNYSNINNYFDSFDETTTRSYIDYALNESGFTYSSYIGTIQDIEWAGPEPYMFDFIIYMDPVATTNYSSSFDYTLSTISITCSHIYQVKIRRRTYNGQIEYSNSGNIGGNNPTATLLGQPNPISVTFTGVTTPTVVYTPNYPFFSYGLTDDGVVSPNGDSVIIDRDVNILPDNDSAIESMEMPQISDYTSEWTNIPTFDSSSVENALQSVYNGIIWLANNIKDTITGTAEYIADTVRWSIQKVINTIRETLQAVQNKIDDVKNAVLTVVDKIQDFFDYVSQPYDSTKVNTSFNNMAIKTDYNNMTTVVNNAFSVFDSTSEPTTFRIPIHLENIPILHINSVQYIDLGWIYDSRTIIRAFMWCVTTFSLLYTIVDALPSYLQGNDE